MRPQTSRRRKGLAMPDGVPSSLRRAPGVVLGVLARVRVDRAVAGTALVAAAALVLVETPVAAGAHDVPVAPALGLAVVHAGAVPLALRCPRLAAVLALAAALGMQSLDAAPGGVRPWWPVLIVTHALVLAAVALRVRWPSALLQWLLALGASAVLAAGLRPAAGDATAVNLTVFGGVTIAVIAASLAVAGWTRIRSELLRERRATAEEAGRRLAMEERTRIARELHDVIAHSMSIITVQATTARFRHPGFDADAVSEFERIGALSRQALDEMRGLLQVLRGTEEPPELRPQPGLDDLPDLVAQAGRAGTPVSLEQQVDAPGTIGELTGLAAYRIAQEAISNAIRHAPGASVQVSASSREGRLHVLVTNDAPATPRSGPGRRGHGLIGMTERAASVGGSVRCGPTAAGGFSVHAVLPVPPAGP